MKRPKSATCSYYIPLSYKTQTEKWRNRPGCDSLQAAFKSGATGPVAPLFKSQPGRLRHFFPEKVNCRIAKGERCAILVFTPKKPGVSEKTALWKLNSAMKCAGPFR